MTSERTLLQNRAIAVIVGLCLIAIAVLSWLRIKEPAPFPHHPFQILGLIFAIFITASIAYRSTFRGDQIVFGAATGALVLAALTAALSLSPSEILLIAGGKAILWTVAALTSLIVLVRGFTISVH